MPVLFWVTALQIGIDIEAAIEITFLGPIMFLARLFYRCFSLLYSVVDFFRDAHSSAAGMHNLRSSTKMYAAGHMLFKM